MEWRAAEAFDRVADLSRELKQAPGERGERGGLGVGVGWFWAGLGGFWVGVQGVGVVSGCFSGELQWGVGLWCVVLVRCCQICGLRPRLSKPSQGAQLGCF